MSDSFFTIYHRTCGQPILLTTLKYRDGDLIRSGTVFALDKTPLESVMIKCELCGSIGLNELVYEEDLEC